MRTAHLALLTATAVVCSFAHSTTGCKSETGTPDARPLGTSVPVTGNVQLDGLAGPVDVVRDSFGMIHIYATSVADAIRTQGYQVARDRSVQLELIRRTAEGRTAEVFGNVSLGLIDDDITQRTIGLTRVASKMCDALDPKSDERVWLDAFADGVSQYYARVQTGDEQLPKGMIGLNPAILTKWSCADSLAIARYQSQALSFDSDSDIERQGYLDKVRSVFTDTSMDPDLKARAGFIRDTMRWAALDPTTTLPGFPNDTNQTMSFGGNKGASPSKPIAANVTLAPGLMDDVRGWLDAQAKDERVFGDRLSRGSNNWMVSAGKSATGHAMIASDPHLSLGSPAVFWMVHLSVHAKPGGDASKDLESAGLSFPGIPGLILGFNEHVAWGATTANYDVTDAYQETLSPDGASVKFKGQDVPLQKIHETIAVAGGAPVEYDVLIVPHHGPIVPNIVKHAVVPPDPKKGAISYRWTGLDPTKEISAVIGLMYAKDVEGFRVAIRNFGVGAQNWVVADDSGNTFYTSQSIVPQRMPGALAWDALKYQGTLPMLVLPGDGSAEWTAPLDEAFIPHVKNPSAGFLATANADQTGVTLDNDPSNDKLPNGQPVYIGGDYDLGLRLGRITKRLQNVGHPIALDDLASIQADVHSGFGERLAPVLTLAVNAAKDEKKTPGTHPDLTAIAADPRFAAANVDELTGWLAQWSANDYSADSGVSPDDGSPVSDGKEKVNSQATLLFNVWLVHMGKRTLDDELALLAGAPLPVEVPRVLAWICTAPKDQLGTLDMMSGESILFDDLTTKIVKETKNQLAITALLDSVDWLTNKLGGDRNKWRWGSLHGIRFNSLVGLWNNFSNPTADDARFPLGFPRHGELHTVDVANYGSHPGKVADLGFTYGSGPTQRLVVEMDPKGPIARNALPGGEVWDPADPHFKDQAEMWRRNQNHPVWLARADVIKDAKERIVYAK